MKRIFGHEDGRVVGADGGRQIRGVPRDSDDPDDGLDRKRVVLAVAVIAVTAVIAAAWLFMLPAQLDGRRLLDEDSVARWYVIRDGIRANDGGFMAQLDDIKTQLDKAAADLEIPADTKRSVVGEALVPEEVAERLRDKIMESGSINQTGQDATQENE